MRLHVMVFDDSKILSLIRGAAHNDELFDREVAQRFLDLGRLSHFPAHSRILSPVARMTNLLIPISEALYAYQSVGSRAIEIHEAGEIIGLAEALNLAPFPFEIRTHNLNQVLLVPFAPIRSLIDHDSKIRWQVISYLAHQLSNRSSELVIPADPAKRLAHLLVDFSEKYGVSDGKHIHINHKISQEELGTRIGASRQSVNKYIQSFIEEGMIAKKGQAYLICDIEALIQFSKTS